jgi:hypothetical protein
MNIHGDAAAPPTAICEFEVSNVEANDDHPVLSFTASTLAVHKRSLKRFAAVRRRLEVHARFTGGTQARGQLCLRSANANIREDA